MRSEALLGFTAARSVELAPMEGADDACEFDDFVSDALGQIVEGELLPHLRQLHQRAKRTNPTSRLPTPEDAAHFHNLLMAIEPPDLDGEVAKLLGSGMVLDTLLVDLLIPAARHLGALWEQDLCDFMAVTIGLGRLQFVTHHLCAQMEAIAPRGERSILLVPSPGETHVYALSIVASFFRKAGWNVTVVERARPDATELLRQTRFDAVGLSLSCDVCLPAMREAVDALRRASLNPALAVVVGGPWVARNGGQPQEIHADICVTHGQSAPAVTEAFLQARTVHLPSEEEMPQTQPSGFNEMAKQLGCPGP